jgi:hypothetical protein
MFDYAVMYVLMVIGQFADILIKIISVNSDNKKNKILTPYGFKEYFKDYKYPSMLAFLLIAVFGFIYIQGRLMESLTNDSTAPWVGYMVFLITGYGPEGGFRKLQQMAINTPIGQKFLGGDDASK